MLLISCWKKPTQYTANINPVLPVFTASHKSANDAAWKSHLVCIYNIKREIFTTCSLRLGFHLNGTAMLSGYYGEAEMSNSLPLF